MEDLRAADTVITVDGGIRPILWAGHRTVDCERHADPKAVLPVRVRAHAFGPGLPRRDRFLSPDHAIFTGGVLILVKRLVNGTSISQMQARLVTYHHIELDEHDLVLAEGLAAESFLDTGNRANFANGGGVMVLHPDFSRGADHSYGL